MGGDILHATSVAVRGKGLLLIGPSGTGKSSLALEMISRGAGLIADDRTCLTRDGDQIIASCPTALSALIEARGIGLLNATAHPPCPLVAVVDLSHIETERFPPRRSIRLLDVDLPLLHKVDSPYFPAALCLYVENGRYRP